MTAWSGEEWARTGAVPEIFEPLREWVNGPIQFAYTTVAYASMAFYGWAFLRTKVLPRWIGWVTLGWSLAWLIVIFATQTTLPAVFLVFPLFFGVAPLVHRQGPKNR